MEKVQCNSQATGNELYQTHCFKYLVPVWHSSSRSVLGEDFFEAVVCKCFGLNGEENVLCLLTKQ